MENTIIIAIVSLLCILAHVPTLILRIVPFHEKISDKDRIRLTVIYAIGLAVDFGICMWVGNYREIDVPFYKINLIAFCIVMAAVNIWLVPGYTKVHLFVFGIVADIVMIALSIGAYVSSLLGMQGNAIGIAETSAIAIVVYALLYPLLSSLLRYTVTPFLEIECQNYWETLWFIPIAMFFSSIFSEGVDVYTTTFPQMLSKCLIGVATLLICFAVSYDQQHFLNEKELNRQIDQQKGYYHALTEQVLAEREARHNFRHQVAAIKGFLDKNDMEGLRGYCDDLELEEMGKKAGFSYVALLKSDSIQLMPEVREMCKNNTCHMYAKRWSCPPGCGDLEVCRKKIEKYREGIIVQTVGKLEDPLDGETMMETEAVHKQNFYEFEKMLRERWPGMLPIGAGCCTKCKTCTYPDAPCRFPEQAFSSMEAYGMLVTQVCQANGLEYYYGPCTIAYTSCYLLE
mgnify:CR=1 FL=1